MSETDLTRVQHDFNNHYGQRLSRLETEVTNIQNTIDGVALSIRDIGTKLSESQKAPWQTMIGAGGLLITIMSVVGFLSLEPLQKDTTRNYEIIQTMAELQNEYLMDSHSRLSVLEAEAANVNQRMGILTSDRYTASQAAADQGALKEELEALDEKIEDHEDIRAHSDIDRRVSIIEGKLDAIERMSKTD